MGGPGIAHDISTLTPPSYKVE